MTEHSILIIAYIFGFYMAWNIGANDLANAMASSVGAKAITIRQAVIIAGILNVIGATFIGSHVTDTIRKGIVSPEIMTNPHLTLIGALSALLASSLWISFATWKSLPVSTTHSIVGAMCGFGFMAGGMSAIKWSKLSEVVMSWIISPFFSLILAWLMFRLIIYSVLRENNSFKKAEQLSPFFIGLAAFIVVLSFLFKTPLGKSLSVGSGAALGLSLVIAIITGFIGKQIIIKFVKDKENGAESIFRYVQVGTSCYVALSQGANDVANAIGPLAVIFFVVKTGSVSPQIPVPFSLLLFGGIGIASGIAMAGYRVMDTLGHKITSLSNTRGYSVDFAAATTVLVASKLGLPVSTTHAAVGGVLGVGLAKGIEGVNFRIVFQILIYWILTVPAAALTSMIIYKLLEIILY